MMFKLIFLFFFFTSSTATDYFFDFQNPLQCSNNLYFNSITYQCENCPITASEPSLDSKTTKLK